MTAIAGNTAIRMIAIDMDGTLLGQDGLVSVRNFAALLAAEAAGIEVVIATGRRHSYAMRILRPLGLHHASALVSSNGTVTRTLGAFSQGAVTIPSRLIAHTHLPLETALWLCNHVDEFRNSLVFTFDRVGPDGDDTRGALVVEYLDQLNASIGRWMAQNEPYIAHIVPIEAALTANPAEPNRNAPIQAMLCGTIESMTRAEARLLEHPGVLASGRRSGRSVQTTDPQASGAPGLASETEDSSHHTPGTLPDFMSTQPTPILTLHRTEYAGRDLSILDILPAGCSKGAAILALAAARSIGPAQILVIGDNWNDVSMFEIAGYSVLMDNAPEDLKALARTEGWRIGLANTDDGVAEAIEAVLTVAVE